MKVKFLKNINISNQINVNKGEVLEAKDNGDFILIRMMDDSTVEAPKSEIDGILEIIEYDWVVEEYKTKSERGRIINNRKFICPKCGKSNGKKETPYCPYCGAKMDIKDRF